MPSPRIAVPVAIGALATASLAAPFAPLYDPWAWLVWGREVAGLDLDTEAGPSWKPLAVMLAALLTPTGGAAPELWLAVARIAWLAAIALAYRLAWRLMFPARAATALATRFAPRRVRLARNLAGAIAALGVLLLFDPFTSWVRQFAGGLSEPLLVALVLGSVDRELSARRGQALALGMAAALLRPEAWPLLAAYGVWLWRSEPRLRRWLVPVAVVIPTLWFLPDLVGSGSPLTGAERAREGSGSAAHELVESVVRSLELPLAALWAASAVAVVSAWQHREREILALGAGVGAWVAIVALFAAGGYAGLPRFSAPAGAVACVLGGVGVVRLLAAIDGMRGSDPRRRMAIALAAALGVVLAVQALARAAEIPGELGQAADDARRAERLTGLVERVGAERLRACPPLYSNDFLTQTQLAWELELPLSGVQLRTDTLPGSGTAVVAQDGLGEVGGAIAVAGEPLGELGEWSAYRLGC